MINRWGCTAQLLGSGVGLVVEVEEEELTIVRDPVENVLPEWDPVIVIERVVVKMVLDDVWELVLRIELVADARATTAPESYWL